MNYFSELKRRNVLKVGAAYLAVTWLLIQVAVSIEGPLNLPEAFDTTTIVILAMGFPIALVIAWAFELTPEGIRVSQSSDQSETSGNRAGQKLNRLIIGALSLAVIFLVADNYVFDSEVPTAGGDEVTSELAQIANSIAILPLEALAGEEDPVLSGGIYYELFRELDAMDRLILIGSDAMQRYANSEMLNREVAAETGARYVLDLKTLFAGNNVRISYELFDFGDGGGAVIQSDSVSVVYPSPEPLEIHTNVARDIAERVIGELSPNVANRLRVTTDNPEAQTAYFTALSYLNPGQREDTLACIEPATRAVNLDAEFTRAWLVKAYCHDIRAVNAGFLPDTTAAAELEAASAATERALAIDPDYAEAYRERSFVMAASSEWLAAGENLEKARSLGIEDGPAGALILASIGRLNEALEKSRLVYERNRYNQQVTSSYLLLLEALGDRQGADDLYAHLSGLYESWPAGDFRRRMIIMGRVRDGLANHSDLVAFITQRDQQPTAVPRWAELLEMSGDRERIDLYLRGWAEEQAGNQYAYVEMAAWAAYYGFPELAFRYLRGAADDFGQHLANVWAPLYRDVRQLDEFEDFMRETSMVDEWIARGWTELCQQVSKRDFFCD
jgi:TolB-like protein